MSCPLRNPVEAYKPRLARFLRLITMVRNLEPKEHVLWHVMDSVAFHDTETALKMALYNNRPSRSVCRPAASRKTRHE